MRRILQIQYASENTVSVRIALIFFLFFLGIPVLGETDTLENQIIHELEKYETDGYEGLKFETPKTEGKHILTSKYHEIKDAEYSIQVFDEIFGCSRVKIFAFPNNEVFRALEVAHLCSSRKTATTLRSGMPKVRPWLTKRFGKPWKVLETVDGSGSCHVYTQRKYYFFVIDSDGQRFGQFLPLEFGAYTKFGLGDENFLSIIADRCAIKSTSPLSKRGEGALTQWTYASLPLGTTLAQFSAKHPNATLLAEKKNTKIMTLQSQAFGLFAVIHTLFIDGKLLTILIYPNPNTSFDIHLKNFSKIAKLMTQNYGQPLLYETPQKSSTSRTVSSIMKQEISWMASWENKANQSRINMVLSVGNAYSPLTIQFVDKTLVPGEEGH